MLEEAEQHFECIGIGAFYSSCCRGTHVTAPRQFFVVVEKTTHSSNPKNPYDQLVSWYLTVTANSLMSQKGNFCDQGMCFNGSDIIIILNTSLSPCYVFCPCMLTIISTIIIIVICRMKPWYGDGNVMGVAAHSNQNKISPSGALPWFATTTY